MSDYPMLISNKLHSFRNFSLAKLLLFVMYEMEKCTKTIYNCAPFQVNCPYDIIFYLLRTSVHYLFDDMR